MKDRTISMMQYEDWRPKPHEMSEAEKWYMAGMQNSPGPDYSHGELRAMTTEELKEYAGTTHCREQQNSFLDDLFGANF